MIKKLVPRSGSAATTKTAHRSRRLLHRAFEPLLAKQWAIKRVKKKDSETIRIQLINNLNTILMLQVHKFELAFIACLLQSEASARARRTFKSGNKKRAHKSAQCQIWRQIKGWYNKLSINKFPDSTPFCLMPLNRNSTSRAEELRREFYRTTTSIIE